MKPKYKVVSSVENKRNDYTPIYVAELRLASDRSKRDPYTHLKVSINLVHGSVLVETQSENGLAIHPYSHGTINITKQ